MLILICGLPRVGKTTLSQTYSFFPIIHLDTVKIGFLKDRYEQVYNHLKTKKYYEKIKDTVIIEGVYNTKKQRQKLIKEYSGYKKCIWLDIPAEIRESRCPSKSVKLYTYFEPVEYDEGWDEIEILKQNP